MAEPAAVLELPRRRSPAAAALVAMRPRQWTKNLLLFAGIIFAAELGDPARWARGGDGVRRLLRGVERGVPRERRARRRVRPAPSRQALAPHRPRRALPAGRSRARRRRSRSRRSRSPAPSARCRWPASRRSSRLQAAYSLGLKTFELVDVLAIAGALRPAGVGGRDRGRRPHLGVAPALHVPARAVPRARQAPRRARARRRPRASRRSTATASALVDQLLAIVAAATIAAYTGYALAAHDTRWLVATVPLVVYGLFRYLLLLHRRGLGEEPETLLVEDLPLLVTVAVWAAACAVILAFG